MLRRSCPFCPDSGVETVFTIRPGNRVLRCAGCRIQFQEHYPDLESAAERIYSDKYFEPAAARLEERAEIFTRMLAEMEALNGGTGRLLDIGSAEGTLLRVAAGRGWEVEGVEVAPAMVSRVRETLGYRVHQGVLEDLALESGRYDLIVLNHVLEHVENPATTLGRVARLLSREGTVRIEVPNLASLSSRFKNLQSRLGLKRNPWKHYGSGHHFWFFTPATMRFAIEESGLELIRMGAPARQWGEMHAGHKLQNAVYGRTLWGGVLVAFARRRAV